MLKQISPVLVPGLFVLNQLYNFLTNIYTKVQHRFLSKYKKPLFAALRIHKGEYIYCL